MFAHKVRKIAIAFKVGSPRGYASLTIKAANGEGARPIVGQAPREDGSWADPDIRVEADLKVQGIHFNGARGETRTAACGRAIRLYAPNVRLVVDNCVFERYWLRTIGFNDQDGCRFYHTNNIHLWDGRDDRIDNGRILDCRSAGVDTIVMEDNTFLNCNDRFIRHMGSALEPIKYCKINHNTFYGNIGYRPPFQFRSIEKLIFTNNIVANAGLLGTDIYSNRLDEAEYTEPNAICLFTITRTDTFDTQIEMHHNNVFTEQRFLDLFALNPDSIGPMPLFNKEFADRIDTNTAVLSEVLSFAHAPSLDSMLLSVKSYILGETNWSNTGFITHAEVLSPEDVDMGYSASSKSATGADDDTQLGDRRWALKNELAVSAMDAQSPGAFGLVGNYPNPFNPETVIMFSLDQPGRMRLTVFNLLGQKIRTLADEVKPAGMHSVVWAGTNEMGQPVPSGVYFYRLDTDGKTDVKKMILMR